MNKIYDVKVYLKTRLSYDWWKYVAIVLIVCLLCYYAFYMSDKLKSTEKIQIFISANIEDFEVEKELEQKFEDQGILDYFFYQASAENKNFDTAFETQGFGNSDILIVPEEVLTETMLSNCVELDEEFKNDCLAVNSEVLFFNSGEKTYGIKIYIKDNSEYNNKLSFNSWLDFDKNYCMVLSKQSQNVGRLSSNSNDNKDKALDTYIYLLGRK